MKKIEPAIEAKIVAEIESGMTSAAISKKYKIHWQTVENVKERNGAIKKSLLPAITNGVRQEIIDKMVAAGVKDKMADGLIEALNAMKTVVIPSQNRDPKTGQTEPGFADEVRDWRTFMDAVENLRKIMGIDAPIKHEIEHKFTVVVQRVLDLVQTYIPAKTRETAEYQNAVTAIFQEVGE